MPETKLDVAGMVREMAGELRLRPAAGLEHLNKPITRKHINHPGLILAGFIETAAAEQIQLLGDSEMLYLQKLGRVERTAALSRLFHQHTPCVIVASRYRINPVMKELAKQRKIPLLVSRLASPDASLRLSNYLGERFAPTQNIHGTLVDVYGTGLLFMGRAGIGKSEIALDLVERGHRLVADDVVTLSRRVSGVLIGSGPEMLKHLIEIRGVGIINVRHMFGVRSIRLQKRIETVVELEDWDATADYERLGLEKRMTKFLDVKLPLVRLPIYPGKNITVIAEAIALNVHLNIYGLNAARDLSRKLLASMRDRRRVTNYLKWDDE